MSTAAHEAGAERAAQGPCAGAERWNACEAKEQADTSASRPKTSTVNTVGMWIVR